MRSLIMHEALSIRIKNVSKVYQLYGSQSDQLIDVLGLQRFGIKTKSRPKEFSALKNVSLNVPRGRRVGVIGRNGAGKTTLLKLICGNFEPSSGEVQVDGTVQALMSMGLGFHPEYTGRENVNASLQYNGLAREEYQEVLEGIIEFCELGDFLDQQFKTYSLGMQARLMFAAATAIKPNILIVDEVLGAGDAYFIAKSKSRLENLVSSGCTMLLVSHSMQQVLELCEEAIWLENGSIRMQGDTFSVVKAYEEAMQVPIASVASSSHSKQISKKKLQENDLNIQEPSFVPFAKSSLIANGTPKHNFQFVTKDGLSRWQGEPGLKICGFTILSEKGVDNKLTSLRPAKIVLSIVGEEKGEYSCRYGIAIHDHAGRCITNIFSPIDVFSIKKEQLRAVNLHLNPCQLGSGHYVIGVSILDWTPIELINSAKRYDLINRSFSVSVNVESSLESTDAIFYHNAEWIFDN